MAGAQELAVQRLHLEPWHHDGQAARVADGDSRSVDDDDSTVADTLGAVVPRFVDPGFHGATLPGCLVQGRLFIVGKIVFVNIHQAIAYLCGAERLR